MSGWWLSGLLVVILNWKVVNSKVDLDTPVRIAHCRATCLYKIQMTTTSDLTCRSSTNCTQCWQTCESLQHNRSPCHQLHCGPGCREACRYPLLSRKSMSLPQHEEVLLLSESRVSWPATAAVYVVMGQRAGRPWTQQLQTLDSSATLPPDLEPESVRVLEVQWRGLTKVYSPPPDSPLAQVQAVLRSLGLEKRVLGVSSAATPGTAIPQSTISAPWNLRVVSMTQQTALVLTQVCWQPRQTAADSLLMYLVTWQLGEGILRGNLLTNSSCSTLSLWPDTVYSVQVAVLSPESHESQSDPLVVDTHVVHTESPSVLHSDETTVRPEKLGFTTHHNKHLPDAGTPWVAGVAASVIMFLVVTLSLTWRWRHRLSLPHTKLVDEDVVSPNIYRVFPPAIRLVAEQKGLLDSVDLLQD